MNKISTIQILSFFFLFYSYPALTATNPLEPIRVDSPRETMRTFMDAMNNYKKGIEKKDDNLTANINKAIQTLDLSRFSSISRYVEGKEAAIFLKEVIDRITVIDYNEIPLKIKSGSPTWTIKNTEIAIALVSKGEEKGKYLFTKNTANRAKEFYNKVKKLPYKKASGHGALYKEPYFTSLLPSWTKAEFFLLPNWQWAGLLCAIFLGLVVRSIFQYSVSLFQTFIAAKKGFYWQHQLLQSTTKPLSYVLMSVFYFLAIHALYFDGFALIFLTSIVRVLFSVSIILVIYSSVDVLTDFLYKVTAKTDTTLDDHLIPLIKRSLRFFILILGALVMFENLGVNVVSVLAGLGLGGLAFALAARDTCANLFGSIMIVLDAPFRVGDWIAVGKVDGVVEDIGFRSTRVRTFYHSLITVPNATMASENIDNYGLRHYRRVLAYLGISYGTPVEKIEAFLEGIKNIILANPHTQKDNFHVVFNSYRGPDLEIMLYCYLKVPGWDVELVERQNIFLEIYRLAKKLGVEFSPTQIISMEKTKDAETLDIANLKKIASNFGPNGEYAKPGGQGVFTPPFQDV